MKRGDPLYRMVLREEVRVGNLLYTSKQGRARPVQAVVVRAVLAVLLSDANRSGVCWPSLSTIAEASELGRASVVRGLGALEAAGLLRRERRAFSPADGKKGRSTIYRLSWSALERLAGMASASHGCAHDAPSASHGCAQAPPTDSRTTYGKHSARKAEAVRKRKDLGDGPDDDRPVSFSEAIRQISGSPEFAKAAERGIRFRVTT